MKDIKPENKEIPLQPMFLLPNIRIDWKKVREMIINDMGGEEPPQPWV